MYYIPLLKEILKKERYKLCVIGDFNECKNYRSIRLLNVIGKIYAGILVDRIRTVTGDLIDAQQGGV